MLTEPAEPIRFYHFTGWDLSLIDRNNPERELSTANFRPSNYWKERVLGEWPVGQASPWMHQALEHINPEAPQRESFAKAIATAGWAMQAGKEHFFEAVREGFFPDAPSRKQCLFGFPLGSDPVAAFTAMGFNPEYWSLLELEAVGEMKYLVADIALLDCNALIVDPGKMLIQAIAYWGGTEPSNPKAEFLFEGRFKIRSVVAEPTKRLEPSTK